MKYIPTLIAMAVGGAVLALGGIGVAQTVKPCVVTVVRIQGVARYSLGDNAWHPLVVGKILGSGAIIQSAANSTVDIVMGGGAVAMPQAAPAPDAITPASDPNVRGLVSYKPMVEQNVIRMWGNTVLAVDKLTQYDTGVDTVSDTELDLRAGRIFFNVKKMSASSQFIIKIPNGVAGIRGSWGTADADTGVVAMGGGSAVESLIINGQPSTSVINAGFQSNPQGGSPIPILPDVLNNFRVTLTSLVTLYESPNGAPVSLHHDETRVRTSKTSCN
ncbi:MAG TPA: FecR domain-containing protein [Verrucomicrobiae bacterium]|nr:FecR domain-containing protein [Verrucomicrobiae bacterium]